MLKFEWLIILIIASMSAFAVVPVADSPDIKVSMISQDPNPVEPGEQVAARFRVENLGSKEAENLTLEIVPKFPFIAVGSKSRSLGTLAGRQKDKNAATASFDLLVDPSSGSGNQEINVKYRYGSTEALVGPFNISVRNRHALVEIVSASSVPELVSPGARLNVTLVIQNKEFSALKDIAVRLDLSSSVPFSPLSGSQEKSVALLKQGETASLQFPLVSLPSAAGGTYKVPVKLTYTDQSGKNYTKDDLISLSVGASPSLIVLINEQGVLEKGKSGEITVQIVNNGLINVKLASAELKPSSGYELLSPSKSYIGNIDSDDFDTLKYKLYIKDSGPLSLLLEVKYMDANNNEYVSQFSLQPRIFSSDEAKAYGLEGSGISGIVIIALVVIAGLLIYSRFVRKKE